MQCIAEVSEQTHVRRGHQDDWPFVFATILHGLYDSDEARVGSPVSHRMHRDTFLRSYHEVVEQFLRRSELLVAEAVIEGTRPIIGYLLYEPARAGQATCLHFAHVKRQFRRNGVFHSLLVAAQADPNLCDASHFRFESEWIFKKWKTCHYNPFRAWPRRADNGTRYAAATGAAREDRGVAGSVGSAA